MDVRADGAAAAPWPHGSAAAERTPATSIGPPAAAAAASSSTSGLGSNGNGHGNPNTEAYWAVVGDPIQTPRGFPMTISERELLSDEVPTFYRRARRGALQIEVDGDVLVKSDVDLPHVGRVKHLFLPCTSDEIQFTVDWYVRPEELRMKRLAYHKDEVFHASQGQRLRTYSVDCVVGRCSVFSFLGYCRYMAWCRRQRLLGRPLDGEGASPTPVYFVHEKDGVARSSRRAKRVESAFSRPRTSSEVDPRQKRLHARRSAKDMEKRNKKGETKLHLAAMRGDVAEVRALLQMGAATDVQDNAGWTPLHEASLRDFGAVAQLLLRQGAAPNIYGPDAVTPLHEAAEQGFSGLCGLLLKYGADPEARNEMGQQVLELAPDEPTRCVIQAAIDARNPKQAGEAAAAV